jgi:hypothetical protein
VGDFFLWHTHPFQCCATFNVHRNYVQVNFESPSYHGLCTNLLKQSKLDVKIIFNRMQNSIKKNGATICFDGWDDFAQRPLLNVMFVCPNGNVFVTFVIDMSKSIKIPSTYAGLSTYKNLLIESVSSVFHFRRVPFFNSTNKKLYFIFIGCRFLTV